MRLTPTATTSAAGWSTKTATTWNGERTWLVTIYRRESNGWKKQVLDAAVSSSKAAMTSSSKRHRKEQNQQHSKKITTPIIPRMGSIVLPSLRQKWSLRSATDQGTVIRRDKKILLISKRRARALLLYFPSLQDCLSFSDRFVELNPPPHHVVVAAPAAETIPAAERKQTGQRGGGDTDDEDDVLNTQQRIINGAIARLLYDEDFLRFVHKIEHYVTNTKDGAQILMGLEQRDLSSLFRN
jgi:hypothetical protein